MDSKLNCFENVSFWHGRLLWISFFHYKSDYPCIYITVGLAPVTLRSCHLKPWSIGFFYLEWLLQLCVVMEFSSHLKISVCTQKMEISLLVVFGSAFSWLRRHTDDPGVFSKCLLAFPFQLWISFLIFRIDLRASTGCNPGSPRSAGDNYLCTWH